MGLVTISNNPHKSRKTHSNQLTTLGVSHAVTLFCIRVCDKREGVFACENSVNQPREAVMTPAEVERRKKDGNRSDWPRKPLALQPGPFSLSPPPRLPPPHPAVPVLTATSHTLHLPSGSGRQRKGQLAES